MTKNAIAITKQSKSNNKNNINVKPCIKPFIKRKFQKINTKNKKARKTSNKTRDVF